MPDLLQRAFDNTRSAAEGLRHSDGGGGGGGVVCVMVARDRELIWPIGVRRRLPVCLVT